MFNLTIRTKTEVRMLENRIKELEGALALMRRERDHERVRSERAVNMVLMKSAKAGINLDDESETIQHERAIERMLDIFGDDESELAEQQRIASAIQADRT